MGTKIAIYCRVSTANQSTDRQKEELLKYAQERQTTIDDNNIYVDVFTGFSVAEERPEYAKLLNAIDKGIITEIWFSEMNRLGRSSVELLSEIDRLKQKNVKLFFKKENISVTNEKNDLATIMLLTILSVTATYEIETFAARTMSGKITKIKGGGGVTGDSRAYGYTNVDKKIKIRKEEAIVVQDIFDMYASGKSVVEICAILNSKHIPSPYSIRLVEYSKNRETKGLPPKEYKHFNTNTLKWRESTISRMLANKLYTGYREAVFHKPQVDKLNEGKEEKPREILYEYKEQIEELRIIDDVVFQRVQERLANASYNKNNAIKHENLLKTKLVCGECGSNFSVGKQSEKTYKTNPRSYKCYGRVSRSDHPRTCTDGAEILQQRLDGFVLEVSKTMFTMIDIVESNKKRLSELTDNYEELSQLRAEKETEIRELKEEHKRVLRRYARSIDNDDIVQELIDEENLKYNDKMKILAAALDKYIKQMASNKKTQSTLMKLSESVSVEERLRNKEWVKTMVDQFIDKIIVYKCHKLWNLIVVDYANGMELWGTIKSARYKNSELLGDENLVKYRAWMLLNSDHCFSYDKVNRKIEFNGHSENSDYNCIPEGVYDYEQLDKILSENNLVGSFPNYAFEENES